MILHFPEGFLWGAAASAEQTEGKFENDGKAETVWEHWHKQNPELFWKQIGPEKTSESYLHVKSDIQRMKAISMNSYRTSISWARLLPDGKTINPAGLDFYNHMIDEMIAEGIEPIINLYHFDTPMLMQEKGGFENREVVDKYVYFAETCFQLFGDRVKKWVTFNEPIVSVECGYLYQYHYPCVVDMKRAVQVAYHLSLANALAIESYHRTQDGEIGIVLNLSPFYSRSNDKEDVAAAEIADLLFNKSFLDPAIKGKYPEKLITFIKDKGLLPEYQKEDLQKIAEHTIDFLGVNYYQPRRVKKRDTPIPASEKIMPEHFFAHYDWPHKKMNQHRGWEIYPEGLYDISIEIKENYGNIPWYVSENGMGVSEEERFKDEKGEIQDDYRIEFLTDHLTMLHKGIEAGSNCFGYHMWCFVDCWSWLNSYKNRYGYYSVDLENDCKRTLKKSGRFMAEVMKINQLKGK